jgi:hypothetical protein
VALAAALWVGAAMLSPSPPSVGLAPKTPLEAAQETDDGRRTTGPPAAAKEAGGPAPDRTAPQVAPEVTAGRPLKPAELVEQIRAEGVKKAKQWGYEPVIVRISDTGTIDMLRVSEMVKPRAKFFLADNDLVVNAGETLFRPYGTPLEQGEYGLVKDGKVIKLPGRLGTFAKPVAKGLPAGEAAKLAAKTRAKNKPPTPPTVSLKQLYAAMARGTFDENLGKKVSWPIPPRQDTKVFLFGEESPRNKDGWGMITGYMLVVSSDEGKKFALLITEGGVKEWDARSREVLAILKNEAIVEGTVAGVYENKHVAGSSAMPFLRDWRLTAKPPE